MPGKKARDSWAGCEAKMAAHGRLTLAGQEGGLGKRKKVRPEVRCSWA